MAYINLPLRPFFRQSVQDSPLYDMATELSSSDHTPRQ